MLVDISSLFPQVFQPYLDISILKRAIQKNILTVRTHNIRDWATDRHHTTDDTPYGGGGGMVMKAEPLFNAVESVLGSPPNCPVILLCPQGQVFNQKIARELAAEDHLSFISGRYESFDERIRQHLATRALSIGDYVLTGGELPALVILDAITRLQPGVLGDEDAPNDDSCGDWGLQEYPQYTKPDDFRGWRVPDILLNGNLGEQMKWKRRQALIRTLEQRPELLQQIPLSEEDQTTIEEYINDKLSQSSQDDLIQED